MYTKVNLNDNRNSRERNKNEIVLTKKLFSWEPQSTKMNCDFLKLNMVYSLSTSLLVKFLWHVHFVILTYNIPLLLRHEKNRPVRKELNILLHLSIYFGSMVDFFLIHPVYTRCYSWLFTSFSFIHFKWHNHKCILSHCPLKRYQPHHTCPPYFDCHLVQQLHL